MKKKSPEAVQTARRGQTSDAHFPLGKFCAVMAMMVIGGLFVFRLSETGGKASQAACLSALTVSFLSGFAGLFPVYKIWGKDLLWGVIGVFLSGVIRLLIGFVGVVIILVFTDIQKTKFIAFLALFYSVFMAFDTWLALWVLRNIKRDETDDQETQVDGNIWNIIRQHRRSA